MQEQRLIDDVLIVRICNLEIGRLADEEHFVAETLYTYA